MQFYCGLDLSARTCQVCVIDEKISVLVQEKVPNEMPCIIDLIEPYKETLEVVVESSFNWYWLVDGLQEAGYDICLAHPLGLYMITGAKVKTDRRDAFALAKLLRAGVIPKAYIYPKEHRSVRDLLRRRSRLVMLRSEEYGSLRRLLYRYGILEHTRNGMRRTIEDDIDTWFKDPMIRLHAQQELKRIWIYTSQIRELERAIFHCAKDRPEYGLLVLVPGIGKILALTILYEIGEISRFESARQFSSYCRVVPGVAQSGTVSRRGRGSKQGNHYLKWAFNQAALHAVRSYPKIRRSYDRHLKRHRGRARKLITYNIIAHRLAQAVYHMLRDGSEYKEELLFGK
jgi:transposase